MSRVALLTGTTGQDGSYLTELLLSKDYYVWGIVRKSSASNKMQNIEHLLNHERLILKYGDVTDNTIIISILQEIKEKHSDLERLEVYHLAGQSNVSISFELPEYTLNVNGASCLKILEAIRKSGYKDKIRYYFSATSEMIGHVSNQNLQTLETPFYPRSPYGAAKLYGYWITKNYRESYGLYACSGILYNHDSKRRDEIFVTRKITKGLSDIIHGRKDRLILGNINPSRDIGHSEDYVRGMYLMMQQDTPKDYILASGETHTIREFLEKAFALRNFDIKWKGENEDEIGYDANTNRELIFISKEFFRPLEVNYLYGDNSEAVAELGWTRKYTFDEIVKEMVDNDCGI